MAHFHAVVWIDHKQARILHFNADEADKTVIHPQPFGPRREPWPEAHRPADARGQGVLRGRGDGDIASAGSILIVGPGVEKTAFAKFLAEKHPRVRANVEGVEFADHPTDGQLLDHARRFLKAEDRMRPQI